MLAPAILNFCEKDIFYSSMSIILNRYDTIQVRLQLQESCVNRWILKETYFTKEVFGLRFSFLNKNSALYQIAIGDQ